jgi:crotonobetainyl-CoA:carnitine CoA-transferase CaiB-like acyl-CoA transferase
VEVSVAEGVRALLPALPLRVGGRRPGVRRDVPGAGADSRAVLADALGLDGAAIDQLTAKGVVA